MNSVTFNICASIQRRCKNGQECPFYLDTVAGRLAIMFTIVIIFLGVSLTAIAAFQIDRIFNRNAQQLAPIQITPLLEEVKTRPHVSAAQIAAEQSHPLVVKRVQSGPAEWPSDQRVRDDETFFIERLAALGVQVDELRVNKRDVLLDQDQMAQPLGNPPQHIRPGKPGFLAKIKDPEFIPTFAQLSQTPPKNPDTAKRQTLYVYSFRIPEIPGQWVNLYASNARKPLSAYIPGLTMIFLTLIAGGLIAVSAGQYIMAPFRQIAQQAAVLGQGDPVDPIPERGVPEMRRVISAFNGMNMRVEQARATQTSLVHALAHDVKSPLVQALKASKSDDPELAQAQLTRAMATIDAITNLATRSHVDGSIERVDLRSILETIVDDFVETGADVTLAHHGDVCVMGRLGAMERIFSNLVENAVKYGERARIHLDVQNETAVTVTIEDDGPGIPKEHINDVMRPFSRGATRGDGHGLGLSIVSTLAAELGWQFTLNNKETGGLSARLTLTGAPLL